jgi:hypothetical protein
MEEISEVELVGDRGEGVALPLTPEVMISCCWFSSLLLRLRLGPGLRLGNDFRSFLSIASMAPLRISIRSRLVVDGIVPLALELVLFAM